MKIKKAIEILKAHNNWRRGHIEEMCLTPKEIGEAIDTVVKELEKPTTPKEIEDARKFIRECHADIGFMGSPEYYEKRKMIEEWDKRKEATE